MSEPVTQVAKAAVAGIKEALAVGKELESVTKDSKPSAGKSCAIAIVGCA